MADATQDQPAIDGQSTTTPTTPTTHIREYEWIDPDLLMDATNRLGGLEMLKEVRAGMLPRPPVMDTIGFDLLSVERGRVAFEMIPQRWHYSPLGLVHGGVLTTLADTAMGCAVHSRLPVGVGYATLEVKLNFVRPVVEETGPIRCEGEVLSLGRRSATAQARITDLDGKLHGHATTTCMILTI
jgi:uncharacterized protein (TIGR00369 family)